MNTTTTRIRLTNDQRAKVRGTLAAYLCRMGLPSDVAVAAVTNGSPAMYESVSRCIARFPSYARAREVTPEMVNLAFAGWVARKAGYREAPETPVQDEPAPLPKLEDFHAQGMDVLDEFKKTVEVEPAPAAEPVVIELSGDMQEIECESLSDKGTQPVLVECDRLPDAM